jgi:hypothetical protein
MEKKDYIARVMLIMNESGLTDSAGNFLLGADVTQIDRHIEGSFVDAWRRCVKVMPRIWFKNESFADCQFVFDRAAGTGYVVLPVDFYLLTCFKMKGWVKAVYEAYVEDDKSASVQSNEYTRGSTIRPICTISNRLIAVPTPSEAPTPTPNPVRQVLNYYSLPKGLAGHVIEEAIYVPAAGSIKDMGESSDLGISDQVLEPLAYLSASTVFTMFEKYDISKALEQRAIEMFPGLQSVKGNNVVFKQ